MKLHFRLASLLVALLALSARGQALPAQARAAEQANRELQLQQFEQDTRFRANPDIPPGERLLLDYGGYASFNYLSVDDANHDNHGLRQYELVGYLRANLDGAQEVFLRARTDYRDYNSGDSFDGFGSRLINPDLDRAYYRLDLQRAQQAYGGGAGPYKAVLEAGRDLDYWANGLVLTEVLDGGRLTLGAGPIDLEMLVGVTPTRTVDIDTSRPDYTFNTRRLFYGAKLTTEIGTQRPFAYAIGQRDHNDDDFSVIGPISTAYKYDSFYFGVGSEGNIDDHLKYGFEAAYENGHTLSNSFSNAGTGSLIPVLQTSDPIQAWALDGRLDYQAEGPHQARFSSEFILASGDHDRGTSTNTFNGIAPHKIDHGFNAFGLLITGLDFTPEVSNLMVLRVGGSFYPLPEQSFARRLQVGIDFFVFGKMLRDAPIDEPTGDQRYLGVEPDLYLNWQVASDVTFVLRYGVFISNHDAFGTGPAGDSRQFFYGGLTFAF